MENIKARLFIEGDFVIYGYGGFYQQPKGWGLDIAYFRRQDLKGFGAKRRAEKFILGRAEALVKSGRAKKQFMPRFMEHIAHICRYEWEFEQSRVIFEYCRLKYAAFRGYNDFNQFAAECMGGLAGMDTGSLLERVKERAASSLKVDIDAVLRSQKGLIARHAADVLRRVLQNSFGTTDGTYLFQQVQKESDGKLSLILDGSEENFLITKAFHKMIEKFFDQRMQSYTEPEYVAKVVKALKVPRSKDKRIAKARRDTLRGLKEIRPELRELLGVMRVPVFIAVSENANFFRNFFNTIPLFVAKWMDELIEYQVFGLCMYEPYYQGGIIVTHGNRTYQRFWHTLVEESSHFADGPTDRMKITGYHRYSGTKAFTEAYTKDKALNPPWSKGKLGTKEWGQAMTYKKINLLSSWRAMKRITLFEATMDFDHYHPNERNAEIFAALPIVERAAGRRIARKIMPNLFAYYDKFYLKGLKEEVKDLKARVKQY